MTYSFLKKHAFSLKKDFFFLSLIKRHFFCVSLEKDCSCLTVCLQFYKQNTKMRQLVFRSADVYCQITNNHFYVTPSVLYWNGKKGKQASCQRDRERVCARDGESLKMELASVVKTAVGRRINYFGISR